MKYINEYRIFENVEKAKKILKELNVDINNPEELEIRQWKDIKDLLKDNMGYLGKFTEMFFKENKQIETLTELYNKLKKIKLDKPIDSFKDYEDIIDYIETKNRDSKFNDLVQELPADLNYKQKHLQSKKN